MMRVAFLSALLLAALPICVLANEVTCGFLLPQLPQTSLDAAGPEAKAARQLAEKLTAAQWEYACRAGTSTPMSYGDLDTNFSPFANLGDEKLREFALDTYVNIRMVPNPNPYDDWVPKDARFNDGGFVSTVVGQYHPNPWGLHDMHGNVCEWTRSAERAYPYDEDDGRNDLSATGRKVVRGGSWYDRPKRCTSSFRLGHQAYQKVFNTGFRVICQ